MDRLGYYLTHPQAIIYSVASALLYPVLFVEVCALIFATAEVGRFTVEAIRRYLARRDLNVEESAVSIPAAVAAGEAAPVIAFLDSLGPSPAARGAKMSLMAGKGLTRSRVLKALADAEMEMSRTLERTRVLIRIGPILGLMGTLIPISPALVGLAKGNVNQLSDNLVVAFSTTVIGLLIGGFGYLVTAVRDRYYQRDLLDIEYVFDQLEV